MLIFLALFPIKTDAGIKFTLFAPDAKAVFLAGDFNGWGRTPMEKNDEGFWETVLQLQPGRYEYKYVVDGEWIPDPDNPVVSGGYQNSVIIVNRSGNVLLPYSSSISFSGVNRMMMHYEKDSLSNMDLDVIFDINLFLSTVEAWTRLRYSGSSIYLNRVKAKFGTGRTKLGAFYNTYALQSDDPFRMIGDIGKYRDSLGRNTTGLYLSDGTNMVFYTNSITDGSDLYGFRLKMGFMDYSIGITGKIKDWYGFETVVDSPTTWYSRKKAEQFGFDISLKKLSFGIERLSEYRGIYQYEVDGEKRDTSLYSGLYKRSRVHLKYRWKDKYLWIRYVEFRFPDGTYFSSIQPGILLKFKGLSLKFSNLYFIKGENLDWYFAFYHPYIQKLMISQYKCAGYRNITELRLKWNRNFWIARAGIDALITKPGPMAEYYSVEVNPFFKSRGKVGVGGDIRYVRYKWSDINTDFTAPFFYLFYRPFGNSEFRISWGLDPYDFEDQKRARETYLENRGILLGTVENYTGFTDLLQRAEKSLSDYRKIEIRATVRFP